MHVRADEANAGDETSRDEATSKSNAAPSRRQPADRTGARLLAGDAHPRRHTGGIGLSGCEDVACSWCLSFVRRTDRDSAILQVRRLP